MKPRILGGFLVVPTSAALTRVAQPSQRADLIRVTLDALKEHRADLTELRADTILEMRDRRRMKWVSIARRFGLTVARAFSIGAARRAELADESGLEAPTPTALADAA